MSTAPGLLSSIGEYAQLRRDATNVTRRSGSNVDVLTNPVTGETIALCHFSALQPFTFGDMTATTFGFEQGAAILLAAEHLNTGDGRLVPQVQGLNERCPIRFTVEMADTELAGGPALERFEEQMSRDPTGPAPIPCAILGAALSSASIPLATVSGFVDIPQVSSISTSTDLDDVTQYPLFGRTIPTDAGTAITVVRFLREVLQAQHVVVINRNDAFGNAYVDAMREAAILYAPDMDIFQVPYNEEPGAERSVIARIKSTGYRYIFGLIDGDAPIMLEAYRQGVAGNGLHNWIFGDSFGISGTESYAPDSPLRQAYRGVGRIQSSGGLPGIPSYDRFVKQMSNLRNPSDDAYMQDSWPNHEDPRYKSESILADDSFLNPIQVGSTSYMYEAVIAMGLSACAAINPGTLTLNGNDHFDAFKRTVFDGVSGQVFFDNITGSRDPTSALYTVENFREQVQDDGQFALEPTLSYLFQDNEWKMENPYIFNDGTTDVPIDKALGEADDDALTLPVIIVLPMLLALFLVAFYFIYRRLQAMSNDMMWQIKHTELTFDDPPQVIGRGTFGLVLLADYRGTQVAVKRIIPCQDKYGGSSGSGRESSSHNKMENGEASGYYSSRMDLAKVRSRSLTGKKSIGQQKQDFIEEMRYISRLRHPCVTTVMGAVIDKAKEEPMLVMEYMQMGSLHDVIHNVTIPLDGEALISILSDVAQGMRFLHSADPQVIHGDLKAQNVLVDEHFRAKVADFGLSQKKRMGGTGTAFWMAPELLRKESTNTSSSDVFSFGVILFEVCARQDPYEGESAAEVLSGVKDRHIQKRVMAPSSMPDKMKVLMGDCMDEDPGRRPPFEEIGTRLRRMDAKNLYPSFTKREQSTYEDIPPHFIDALEDGRKPEGEAKQSVALVACQIIDFDRIVEGMSRLKVEKMLDRLNSSLRDLSKQHGLFILGTEAPVFMAAANLVHDQSQDHCKRVAEFATEAIRVANRTLVDDEDPGKAYVCLRVGIHCGRVVANVVGHRNPKYCLFGETVYIASRMARFSKLNQINCSQDAADWLRKQQTAIELRPRDPIHVRGKGMIECYWASHRESAGTAAVERVRASQKLRFLNHTMRHGRTTTSSGHTTTHPENEITATNFPNATLSTSQNSVDSRGEVRALAEQEENSAENSEKPDNQDALQSLAGSLKIRLQRNVSGGSEE